MAPSSRFPPAPHPSELGCPSSDTLDRDLRDPSSRLSSPWQLEALLHERLNLGRDAALLLQDVYSIGKSDESILRSEIEYVECELRRKRCLKLDIPEVGGADWEVEASSFGKGALEVPTWKDFAVRDDVLWDEEREGEEMAWPRKYRGHMKAWEEKMGRERLGLEREGLELLGGILRGEELEQSEIMRGIWDEVERERTTPIPRPLTPPLLPLSPPHSPYVPSSPANRISVLSESSDSLLSEARAIEQQIMATDSITRETSDSADSMLYDLLEPSSLSPSPEARVMSIMKRKVEDLKIEGPLTPPILSDSPMKKLKSVSFVDEVFEIRQGLLWESSTSENGEAEDGADDKEKERRGREESLEETNTSELDLDALFDAMEPVAVKVNRSLANEQLTGADTVARVSIPPMDFSLPIAPWQEYTMTANADYMQCGSEIAAQCIFLRRIVADDLRGHSSWNGMGYSDLDLQWNIFTTKISKITIKETLHGQSELEKLLQECKKAEVVRSDILVWKKEGLRILDEEEDEEGIDEMEVQEGEMGVEALVRKRKAEMTEEVDERQKKQVTTIMPSMISDGVRKGSKGKQDISRVPPKGFKLHQMQNTRLSPRDENPKSKRDARLQRPGPSNKGQSDGLMFGGFSATTALSKFMSTQGKTMKVVKPALATPQPTTLPIVMNTHHEQRGQAQGLPSRDSSQRLPPALPHQSAPPSDIPPASFILSTTLLNPRALLKQVTTLYPTANIIYRDYALPHSPSSAEATIILSPSTGLIWTTLQQLKQRALPGQREHSAVRELLSALQNRYERIVVLVSEGLTAEMERYGEGRVEDQRDAIAVQNLEVFATRLECDTEVSYVKGGEAALAHAIVLQMAKWGLPHGSKGLEDMRPLPVETTWELFLRRAGLNPFAAQVILATLKDPQPLPLSASDALMNPASLDASSSSMPIPSKEVQVAGLPAFVMMSAEERGNVFQALLGGRRVLDRVGKMLDQGWVSAVNGFQVSR